ncbi:MAG: polysaccharide deacetylase family protein [Candidatus Methanomethylicaceae archaeon]
MFKKPILSLTFDIEMCTNFPYWTSIWDDRKGLIDDGTRQYINSILDIARKENVKFQFFLLGSSFRDHKNVSLFKNIVYRGHSIGNHTYNHINIKTKTFKQLQIFYVKKPNFLKNFKNVFEAISYEIEKTNILIQKRLGIDVKGFRAPYGFENGIEDMPRLQHFLLEKSFEYVSSQYRFQIRNISNMINPGGFINKTRINKSKICKRKIKELDEKLKN